MKILVRNLTRSIKENEVKEKDVSAADWMVAQQRYAHRFEIIPRVSWASDQVPVAAWLRLRDEQKNVVQPFVERSGRRYLPSAAVLSYSKVVFEMREKATVHRPAASTALSPAASSIEAAPVEELRQPARVAPDALHVLTEKLLALSGFADAGESLAGWQEKQEEVTEE